MTGEDSKGQERTFLPEQQAPLRGSVARRMLAHDVKRLLGIAAVKPSAFRRHAAGAPGPTSDSLVRGRAVEPQDYDLGFHDLRWPGEHRKAGRDGDLLRAVRVVGNHAAGNR